MKIKELGEFCKNRNIDCDSCPYKNFCTITLPIMLEDISPYSLLFILDREVK